MDSRPRIELRRALLRIAQTQAGYFTAKQARGAGYSYQAQRYNADRGHWTRIDRGVYRIAGWPHGEHEDFVRWTLWSGGVGVVSHDSAAVVHDLGVLNPAQVHLTVAPSFGKKARGVVLHVALLPPEDVTDREGFRVTTIARTIFDLAATMIEIHRLADVISDALKRGTVSKRMLRERSDAFGNAAALHIERALGEIVA